LFTKLKDTGSNPPYFYFFFSFQFPKNGKDLFKMSSGVVFFSLLLFLSLGINHVIATTCSQIEQHSYSEGQTMNQHASLTTAGWNYHSGYKCNVSCMILVTVHYGQVQIGAELFDSYDCPSKGTIAWVEKTVYPHHWQWGSLMIFYPNTYSGNCLFHVYCVKGGGTWTNCKVNINTWVTFGQVLPKQFGHGTTVMVVEDTGCLPGTVKDSSNCKWVETGNAITEYLSYPLTNCSLL
jgi:hypothetical protein